VRDHRTKHGMKHILTNFSWPGKKKRPEIGV
jgi:hypothetical protein